MGRDAPATAGKDAGATNRCRADFRKRGSRFEVGQSEESRSVLFVVVEEAEDVVFGEALAAF